MHTITSKRDFDRVFSTGKRAARKTVRVVVASSPEAGGRVAFVAPKRVGKAVFRNRCKRVLRACADEAGLPRGGRDVVLMATRATATAEHEAVVKDVRDSMGQAAKRLAKALAQAGDDGGAGAGEGTGAG